MTTEAAADVRKYRDVLARVVERFRQTAQQELERQDTFALIIDRGLGLALGLHEATALLLEHRQPIAAAIVARSVFELSVKYLWASRETDGWERLQAKWRREDRDHLQRAEKCPQLREWAAQIRSGLPPTPDHISTKLPPNMRAMLEEIEKRDREENPETGVGWGMFYYLVLYAWFSNVTHAGARTLVLTEADDVPSDVRAGMCMSAIYFARALCYTYQWNVDEVTAPLVSILAGA